ncbi:MAG: protein kinase [Candidatus Acidiferrales bacterium]
MVDSDNAMIGKQISSYRILEKLGEGGMGVVYKAVDTDLDRLAAMKVLGSDFSKNPELVGRFRAEAKAQANLNHTNLATLYAFLLHDGTAYMIMEFIDGETFEQMVQRRGPIPEQEAIPLFKQALLGIGYAHRAGIIHRDIKPSNLMLNKNGIVKVMDFGIAKVMGARGLTRTGTQMGTVAYMSPEQIQNRAVDIRSDIYELGVTLFEMLSGHLPFESDSDFQVMQDHVSKVPPLPTRFYPYISKGIEKVVLKSLEKNPDARFQSVEEFGSALEHPDSFAYAPAPVIAEQPSGVPHGTVLESQMPGQSAPPTYAPPKLAATVPLTAPASGFTPPTVAGTLRTVPGTLPGATVPPPSFWTQKKWFIAGAAVVLAAIVGVVIHQQSAPVPNVGSEAGGGGGTDSRPESPVKPPPDTGQSLTIDGGDSGTPLHLDNGPSQPTPHTAPHTQSNTLSASQMYQNAQTALRLHHYFEPVNNSALYWAIQARKGGSADGKALENQILEVYRNKLNEYIQAKNYQGALNLVNGMLKFYPGDPGLLAEQKKLQAAISASK